MSCGAWAKQALEEDENLQKLILIGPSREALEEIEVEPEQRKKLIYISWEELEAAVETGDRIRILQAALTQMDETLPLYLSIDKDILSEGYARTNWDQGQMSLSMLKEILAEICQRNKVLGVDICGELPDAPSWQQAEVRNINERTNTELYDFLKEHLR